MNKHYTINNRSRTTTSAQWIEVNGVELQYQASGETVWCHDGYEWVQADFISEADAEKVALEINGANPACTMTFEVIEA